MTGVLSIVAGARSMRQYSVTIGTGGVSNFGFDSFGSISSNTFKGETIISVVSDPSFDIQFALNNTGLARTFIDRIVVQDTTGTYRTYKQVDASYSNGFWIWGNGSSKVWTATTPSPRELKVYY